MKPPLKDQEIQDIPGKKLEMNERRLITGVNRKLHPNTSMSERPTGEIPNLERKNGTRREGAMEQCF